MQYIADLHIHSRFSRGTSKSLSLALLATWAKIKGVSILGTGDFTHPGWMNELKGGLEPAEPGLYKMTDSVNSTRFLLTSEISLVYSQKEKSTNVPQGLQGGAIKKDAHKVHILVMAPTFQEADKIINQLSWVGNLKSDGRPILGLEAEEFVKMVFEASPYAMVVPAHIWTPWFSLFGSRSGYDSIVECFGPQTEHIFALETGLSSDPAMNWMVPQLDKYTLISNSDAHSCQKIAREANIFEGTELSYKNLRDAIKAGGKASGNSKLQMKSTIEFFPEEGKYHYDGHREHNIRFSPEESALHNNICPVCGKPLTIGVLNRVEQLASGQKLGRKPEGALPFVSLVPLSQIIAQALSLESDTGKAVEQEYQKIISIFKTELDVLLNVGYEDMSHAGINPKVIEGILKVRQQRLYIDPGYDGEYGHVKIWEDEEKAPLQNILF